MPVARRVVTAEKGKFFTRSVALKYIRLVSGEVRKAQR
jgi:hypothetical protein